MPHRNFTHRQRLEACLGDVPLDRPPVALWRHFPVDDQTPGGLAAAHLFFQRTYDFDLVKVTPASSFCVKDWGAQDEWRGSPEGTRDYTHRVVREPEDWERLRVLDPNSGYLGQQLECLRMLVLELAPDTPILQTIFSPLAQAKNLVGGDNLLVHLRRYPDALHQGLRTIAETTQNFIEAAQAAGIDGIFYAVQHAQYGLLSSDEYDEFGAYYDLQLLDAAQPMWLNMLHLHGTNVMFDQVANFPVHVINWHDRETYPSVKEALNRFEGVVCGGLERIKTMVLGSPEQVHDDAKDAILAAGGERIILGTGCVLPITAPHGNILAARESVGEIPTASGKAAG